MVIGIIRALRELAVLRAGGKKIYPLPNKTWSQCYTHLKVGNKRWHKLDYHIEDDRSAVAIVIEY